MGEHKEFGCSWDFERDDREQFEKAVKELRADARKHLPKGSRIEWRAKSRNLVMNLREIKYDSIAWYSLPWLFTKRKEWDFPMADFEDVWKIKPRDGTIIFGRETI